LEVLEIEWKGERSVEIRGTCTATNGVGYLVAAMSVVLSRSTVCAWDVLYLRVGSHRKVGEGCDPILARLPLTFDGYLEEVLVCEQ
jgi:hypothetical protein